MSELLGKVVKDKYTGKTGIATLYTISVTGQKSYLVEPRNTDGDPIFFEKERLEEIGEVTPKEDVKSTLHRGEIFRR